MTAMSPSHLPEQVILPRHVGACPHAPHGPRRGLFARKTRRSEGAYVDT